MSDSPLNFRRTLLYFVLIKNLQISFHKYTHNFPLTKIRHLIFSSTITLHQPGNGIKSRKTVKV